VRWPLPPCLRLIQVGQGNLRLDAVSPPGVLRDHRTRSRAEARGEGNYDVTSKLVKRPEDAQRLRPGKSRLAPYHRFAEQTALRCPVNLLGSPALRLKILPACRELRKWAVRTQVLPHHLPDDPETLEELVAGSPGREEQAGEDVA
jgi:hypothetical protein